MKLGLAKRLSVAIFLREKVCCGCDDEGDSGGEEIEFYVVATAAVVGTDELKRAIAEACLAHAGPERTPLEWQSSDDPEMELRCALEPDA